MNFACDFICRGMRERETIGSVCAVLILRLVLVLVLVLVFGLLFLLALLLVEEKYRTTMVTLPLTVSRPLRF